MIFYSGIAHYVNKALDIFKYKAEGKDSFTIVLAARLSGKPHIGTLINFLTGFKLAQEFKKIYKKDAFIKIELLDNISDTAVSYTIDINSETYFYKNSIVTNKDFDENYKAFLNMIKRIEMLSNCTSEIYTYEQIQLMPEMREAVMEVIQHYDFFSKLFDPKNHKIHLRVACPKCGLIEKSCNHTQIYGFDNLTFKVKSVCPTHGEFSEFVSIDNDTYIDLNVPLRHFCKGFSLIKKDKRNNSLSVQVLGNDWSGLWPMRMFCEGVLKFNIDELPSFLFSPLIIDNEGKISKSKISSVECADAFANVNLLTDKQVVNIWKEIEKWFEQPELFFTNYKLDDIKRIANTNE